MKYRLMYDVAERAEKKYKLQMNPLGFLWFLWRDVMTYTTKLEAEATLELLEQDEYESWRNKKSKWIQIHSVSDKPTPPPPPPKKGTVVRVEVKGKV